VQSEVYAIWQCSSVIPFVTTVDCVELTKHINFYDFVTQLFIFLGNFGEVFKYRCGMKKSQFWGNIWFKSRWSLATFLFAGTKELNGLSRSDGNRPDRLTTDFLQGGKCGNMTVVWPAAAIQLANWSVGVAATRKNSKNTTALVVHVEGSWASCSQSAERLPGG